MTAQNSNYFFLQYYTYSYLHMHIRSKSLFILACSTAEFSLVMSVVRRATIDTHIGGGFEQVQQGICRSCSMHVEIPKQIFDKFEHLTL